MQKQYKFGAILLVAVMFVLLYLRFPDFFESPNTKVMEPWGDGYKAYMSIYNHAKYDSTYAHFEGMNYPYGEHAVPGATQPLISGAIKFISEYFIDITGYTIGIVNWSLLLGLILCALFCYLIFKRLNLPPWYSFFAAIGIAFLNPQVARMTSHYGLAHPEVMPVIIYLLLRFEQERKWKWSALIALAVWAFSLIHFYYFALLAFMISGYFLFLTVRDKNFSLQLIWQNFKHYSLQMLVPLSFFIYWIYWNDVVDDRCSAPWGFFVYHAEIAAIFVSLDQPFFQGLGVKDWGFESKAYIGVIAGLMTLFFVLKWLFSLFRKAPIKTDDPVLDSFLNKIFFSSFAVLLFSFGLPFVIHGLEGWIEYAGPIQQFRSVGRFAWAFFYSINIISFYWLYKKFKNKKWLLFLALGLLNYEAWNNVNAYNLKLDEIKEFDTKSSFANIEEINYNDYQAVIPIPYYNIGSDHFWIHIKGFIGQTSQTLSMQTGLPLTAAMLTRTSLSQTLNQLQLVMEPYRKPKILDDLPDSRPFLLMWDALRAKHFDGKYDHLKEGLEMVYERYPLQFYTLPLDKFSERIEHRKENLQQKMQVDTLFKTGQLTSLDRLSYYFYNNFDTAVAEKYYKGNGGFEGKMNEENRLFNKNIPVGKYNFSTWMFINADLYSRTEIVFEEYTPDGKVVNKKVTNVHYLVKLIDSNGWALLEYPLEVKAAGSKVKITLQNKTIGIGDVPLYIDELLIRPQGSTLLMQTEEWLFENNRWFEQ